jgi:hypothetical protein
MSKDDFLLSCAFQIYLSLRQNDLKKGDSRRSSGYRISITVDFRQKLQEIEYVKKVILYLRKSFRSCWYIILYTLEDFLYVITIKQI